MLLKDYIILASAGANILIGILSAIGLIGLYSSLSKTQIIAQIITCLLLVVIGSLTLISRSI